MLPHQCSCLHQTRWKLYSSSPLVEEAYNKNNTNTTCCHSELTKKNWEKSIPTRTTALTLWWLLHVHLAGYPQSIVSDELRDPWQPREEKRRPSQPVNEGRMNKTKPVKVLLGHTFNKLTESRCAWRFGKKIRCFLTAKRLVRFDKIDQDDSSRRNLSTSS